MIYVVIEKFILYCNKEWEKESDELKGKDNKFFFGIVEIKENGDITIPKEALLTFNFKTGDKLAVFGDLNQGLALADAKVVTQFAKDVLDKEN